MKVPAFLKRNVGLVAVLACWAAIFAINAFDIAPSVKFRGVRFTGGDFGQYYMGAVAARDGLWDEMYPVDLATAPSPDKSSISPALETAVKRRGGNVSWKFIYPPPLAVFLAPFDWVPFAASRKAFTGLLFASVVWFLVLFRRECDDWGLPPVLAQVLVFAVGTGLPVCESVLMANSTPLVALASLVALRALRKNDAASSVFAFALAGLLKGFSAAWIPALFLWKHCKTIVVGAIAAIVVAALPHLFGASLGVWETFARDVVPGSRKLYWIGDGNLGLPSFFAWLMGGEMPPRLASSLSAAQFFVVALAYFLAWSGARLRKAVAAESEGLALFVATLAFQLFSPICWPHYAFNVIGFLPMALSIAGVRSGGTFHGQQWLSPFVVAFAFSLAWFPVGNAAKAVSGIAILGFGRTLGYVLMLSWGLSTLVRIASKKTKAPTLNGK